MNNNKRKTLLILLLVYGVASLIHFMHNAEFLANYPNLPTSWTRAGIYLVWLEITMLGIGGWLLMVYGYSRLGLLMLAIYALLGMDSLGHYILAPMSEHTLGMNSTILFEVTAAVLVLIEVIRTIMRHLNRRDYMGNGI